MKILELEGRELDYWVAKAINHDYWVFDGDNWVPGKLDGSGIAIEWHPSSKWEDCGPLIDTYIKGFRAGAQEWDKGLIYAIINGPYGELHTLGNDYKVTTCTAILQSVYGEEVPD